MARDAAPPPTRRQLRTRPTPSPLAADAEAPGTLVVEQPGVDPVPAEDPAAATAPATGPLALAWVDEATLAAPPAAAVEHTASPPGPDLLAGVKRRSIWRPGVLVPTGLLAGVVALYVATTLLWPLHAIAPRIEPVALQPVAAAAATPAWPSTGGAAISIAGIDGSMASSGDPGTIASITKVVTALLVLDEMPLARGESGPEYAFTAADRTRYWQYRSAGESALDVPVGGALTQYQLLEGMLIGSANNYADRLAGNLWPSDAVFADAARRWLDVHGVPGISIVDPSGIEAGNTATPEALLTLAAKAMAHPVIAEIVGKPVIDLPGAGRVENTNDLLDDAGVVGIKTGTLDAYNLLSAKDVTVGGTAVRLYAAVLGQPGDEARDAASRALFAQMELDLQPRPSVTAGTVAGQVVTRWGEPVDVVVSDDATVVLWNGGSAVATAEFALGDEWTPGEAAGELAVSGPLDSAEVGLELAGEIEAPSPWWRLTHPLDLFGLNG